MTPALLLAQLAPAVETARSIGSLAPTALISLACLGLLAALVYREREAAAQLAAAHAREAALHAARQADTERLLSGQVTQTEKLVAAAQAMEAVPEAIAADGAATRAALAAEGERTRHHTHDEIVACIDAGRGLHDATRREIAAEVERSSRPGRAR